MDRQIREALDGVRCEAQLQEKTRAYLAEQRQRRSRRNPGVFSGRLMPMLAMLAVVVSVLGFQYLHAPVAYVSIDVNPSMELSLNRMGTVTAAKAYNEDGSRVLQGLSLTGLKMTDALESILSSQMMQSYLTGENDLTFTVAAGDSRREEAILAQIARNPICSQNCGMGYHGNLELMEEAHQAGMSLGKYSAYLELCQYDDTMTVERCSEMSMAQIHACIREYGGQGGQCSGSGSWGAQRQSGHGNGHGKHGK